MEREKPWDFANGLTELTREYLVAPVTQSLSYDWDTLNMPLSIGLQSVYFVQKQLPPRKVFLAKDESCFG